MKTKGKEKMQVIEGSGNVFADLGFPNPEQDLLKARLMLQIYTIIKDRGLTQKESAEILRVKQPHISELMRGRAGTFSMERLMKFLTLLGQDVEITVKPARKRKEHGAMFLVLA